MIPSLGLTMDAPRVGFPFFCDPSVYMKLFGSHAAWKGLGERGRGVCGGVCVYGYCSVYEVWLLMCFGSFSVGLW